MVKILKNMKELDKLNGLKIICSTREKTKNIKNIMKKNQKCDRINLVIGPEGGLTEEEEEHLNKMGFISTSLGSRIMRVETVPMFVLSIINYEFME